LKLSELRGAASDILAGGSEERPLYVVDVILARKLGISKSLLIVNMDEEITLGQCREILSMVERRAAGEPLSYILGEAEFYGRVFKVGRGVLIPRPETELLTEEMIKRARDGDVFADWCTGSGCIGATILLETERTKCFGVDSSPEALAWTRQNIKRYYLSDRFALLQNGNPLDFGFTSSFFDFIVANPPYIPSEQLALVMRDVIDFEPIEALDGGEGGIALYQKFFTIFPRILKPGGYFGCETAGDVQSAKLQAIAPAEFRLEQKIYDYKGILRHLIWQKRI